MTRPVGIRRCVDGWQQLCTAKTATMVCLQLSDKAGGAEFTADDADRIRELAAFAGATLDALRAAKERAAS